MAGANQSTGKSTDSTGDKDKPTDTDAANSVGANNPNQSTGAGSTSGGADQQGAASRNAEEARRNGEPPASATVDQTVNAQVPGRLPSEAGGFSPAPHPDSGAADSDKVPYTQAVQRLVHPADLPGVAQALSLVVNLPPGSRPLMLDPATGLGVVPPQTIEHDQGEGEQRPEQQTAA